MVGFVPPPNPGSFWKSIYPYITFRSLSFLNDILASVLVQEILTHVCMFVYCLLLDSFLNETLSRTVCESVYGVPSLTRPLFWWKEGATVTNVDAADLSS